MANAALYLFYRLCVVELLNKSSEGYSVATSLQYRTRYHYAQGDISWLISCGVQGILCDFDYLLSHKYSNFMDMIEDVRKIFKIFHKYIQN